MYARWQPQLCQRHKRHAPDLLYKIVSFTVCRTVQESYGKQAMEGWGKLLDLYSWPAGTAMQARKLPTTLRGTHTATHVSCSSRTGLLTQSHGGVKMEVRADKGSPLSFLSDINCDENLKCPLQPYSWRVPLSLEEALRTEISPLFGSLLMSAHSANSCSVALQASKSTAMLSLAVSNPRTSRLLMTSFTMSSSWSAV